MKKSLIAAAAALVSFASLASDVEDTRSLAEQLSARGSQARCAVQDPGESERAFADQLGEANNGIGLNDDSVVTINVYWHVITTTSGYGNGATSRIPAQMEVLDQAYAGSRFAFNLASVEVVANNTWFLSGIGSPEEVAMKAALHEGGARDLNIYTTNGDGYLGWATFPAYYNWYGTYDGVVLWWAALPGTGLGYEDEYEPDGKITYDEGDTATHEVGHWLGLYHTFAGGCSKPGDFVKDTPTEGFPQFYCIARDSCTGPVFPGADPIHNFMDYVDDVCMDHFTAEQTKRMRKQWHAFRAQQK